MKKKPTLTASKMKTYLQCGRKYRYTYVNKFDCPNSVSLPFGNAFHDALEYNYAQKVSTEKDLPIEDVCDRFREVFPRVAEGAVLEPGQSIETLTDLGVRMLVVHHGQIAPTVRPLFVERSFRISLGEAFPFDLSGKWDLIDQDGLIIDNKSYKSEPKQEWVDRDLQLDVYSLAYRLLMGECENGLRIDAVTKARSPRVVQVFTTRNNEDASWLLRQIEEVAKGIQAGVFYPNRDSNLCKPEYCGHWERCRKERSIG
jgi:hypothetical protein